MQHTATSLKGSPFHRLSHVPPSSAAPQHADSPSEVASSLLEILKLALSTANGKLNLESLSRSFRKEDHALSGFLPPPKVTKLEFSSDQPKSLPRSFGSIVRRPSYDLCSACGLHHTVFCLLCQRGEKQKRKEIEKCAALIQELLILSYILCQQYGII